MVKAKTTTYEEIRQQRLEENKKRMEELNLNKLAQSIRTTTSPKATPMKPRTPRTPMTDIEIRRSSRVANLPTPPVYKELSFDGLDRPRRVFVGRTSNSKRDLSNRVYASEEARLDSIERADDLESKLQNGFPSFVKPMLQSHVTGGFWLGLPSIYCKENLPKNDDIITLVDENGNDWPTVWLARKNGLSGGWKAFAVDHDLVHGDTCIFELVEPTKFKVYIIRVNG
ncbi:hypothetical protein ACHQM5_022009 [Ranunculus cassubicifolius]